MRALLLGPVMGPRVEAFYSRAQVEYLADDFAFHDTAWGCELHLAAMPHILRRPVQVWRRAGPGAVAQVYPDCPFGRDDFGEDGDGNTVWPADLLYSRDRDEAGAEASRSVDAGGHYDVLQRIG